MSKKKSFSGSTMTLKDFHGGSIPSDLPLPSAPGVLVRQLDRAGFERPIGGIGGRTDQYRPSRPGSAGGGSRGFGDESAPFLPHSARIGRNFDEDERKPFDASAAPRRVSVAVDADRVPRSAPDVAQQQQKGIGRPGSSPAAMPHLVSGGSSFPVAGVGSTQQLSGYGSGGSGVPNAWGVRKEVGSEHQVQSTSALSGPAAASRFAQASALEKISSGRWQTKNVSFSQTPTAEIIRFSDADEGGAGFQDHGVNGRVDGLERRYNEVGKSAGYPEVKERRGTLGFCSESTLPESSEGRNGGGLVQQLEGRSVSVQGQHQDGRFGGQQVKLLEDKLNALQVDQQDERLHGQQGGRFRGAQVHQQAAGEVTERPKLNLLPRTKPLESSEIQASDAKKPTSDLANVENHHELYGNQKPIKPGSSGSDGENRTVDRTRLNLKPRSQSPEQTEVSIERERKSLFGGARPRELVLKERGCDNPSNDLDPSLLDTRVKHDLLKMDVKPDISSSPNCHSERTESSFEHRVGRGTEKKEYRAETEKSDLQRTLWKNDKWRNTKVHEKPVERRPEPDSWRKPVEEPKPDTPSPRHGKAASALELAQVYSRSASESRSDGHATKQGGVPGHNQMIFSRLTDNREFRSGPHIRKINGY